MYSRNRCSGESYTLEEEEKVSGSNTYPLLFCVNIPTEGESLKQQFKEPYK